MRLRRAFAFACLLVLVPRIASAVQYEVFIDIETEEDLYDLLVTEQISESSFDALLLLHQTRVDLNRADRQGLYLLPNLDYAQVDRILAYRKEAEVIHGLGDLIAAGVLEAELVESLRPFVIVRAPDVPKSQTNGFVRVQGRWSGRYDRLPPRRGGAGTHQGSPQLGYRRCGCSHEKPARSRSMGSQPRCAQR